MVRDSNLHRAQEDSAAAWAPVHAWRALGQLNAESAVKPLVDMLVWANEHDDDWAQDELPTVLGLIGPAALPELGALLDAGQHGNSMQNLAVLAVLAVAEHHPDSRNACIDLLAAQLARYKGNAPWKNGALVGALVELRAVDQTPLMAQVFAGNRVDLAVNGDWEDVQFELGLLATRQTPPRRWIQPGYQA